MLQDRRFQPAVFLDRDGVINENEPGYVRSWSAFRFIPSALDAVRRLTEAGLPVVVVTNQAGVGRGVISCDDVEEIHNRMLERIEAAGGRIDRILYCPHVPDENCECRKPAPGLLHAAAAELGIELEASFMVGDHLTDLDAGTAAGCTPILVRTGRGQEALGLAAEQQRELTHVVDDIAQAVSFILSSTAARSSIAAE